jgi:hypothetical protein
MIPCLKDKGDDIRYDLMGEFCPYVIYSGEDKESMYPFTIRTTKEDAVKTAKLMSTYPVPVGLFIEVAYLPDKNDMSNKEVLWSKFIEPTEPKKKPYRMFDGRKF